MFFAKLQKFRQTRHRAVRVQDLAKHAGRGQTGEAGQIHAGLGVTSTPQDAAGLGAQREDVSGLHEIERLRAGFGQDADRLCAIVGADAGGDAASSIDRDGEVGAVAFAILQDHPLEAELLRTLIRDRRTDQAAAVGRHEIHGLGGDFLRGHDEIALVFSVRIVGYDDELSGTDVIEHVFDRVELRNGVGHGKGGDLNTPCGALKGQSETLRQKI